MRLAVLLCSIATLGVGVGCGRVGFAGAGEPAGRDAGRDGATGGTAGTLSFGERAGADVTAGIVDTFLIGQLEYQDDNVGRHYDLHASADAPALLRFELSALPPGTPVTSARLDLWTGDDGPASTRVGAFEVREAWQEGTGDWSPGVANWIERLPGVPWTSPGVGPGSKAPDEVGSMIITGPNAAHRLDLDTALVQRWVDAPADNHGIALFTGGQYVEVMAREADDPTLRPLLTIAHGR